MSSPGSMDEIRLGRTYGDVAPVARGCRGDTTRRRLEDNVQADERNGAPTTAGPKR